MALILCVCMSIFSTWFYLKGSGIPEKSYLSEAIGFVEYVRSTGKYGNTTRFKFKDVNTHFVYHSIGGHVGSVQSFLSSTNEPVKILFNAEDSHSPPLDSNDYYTVYEIKAADKTIRSYSSVLHKYEDNAVLAGYMAVVFIGFSIYLWKLT